MHYGYFELIENPSNTYTTTSISKSGPPKCSSIDQYTHSKRELLTDISLNKYILGNVECDETENDLFDCAYDRVHDCDHTNDL